jgi:alpha-aminoadipic semialdehyde synthase
MLIKRFCIRREDKSLWEARVPISPKDAEELYRKHQIQLIIQPSSQRVFDDEAYRNVGALVQEKLDASFVFGVKEIPVEVLEANKTYICFSHTIKRQPYNMPMLYKMMALNDTLIDYELIKDAKQKRLIAFGRYAGIAGMIDALWAFGKRLEFLGYETPFSQVERATVYESIEAFVQKAKRLKSYIESQGLPDEISPCVIGITGYGNVSKGAQEILDLLPIQKIMPSELENLPRDNKKLHVVIFKEQDMFAKERNEAFDLQDYYQHPEKYHSIFEQYLPSLSILVNAIYWENSYPRLVTKAWLKENKAKLKPFWIIADISCDIEGAIECTVKSTEPGDPVYIYDPESGDIRMGWRGHGVLVGAVDILPAEFPKAASEHFSAILKNFVVDIVNADYPERFEDCTLPPALKNAVILYKGKLTEHYRYLAD